MPNTQALEEQQPKVPSTAQFITIVTEQLEAWSALTLDGLCEQQTETVIKNLAPHFTAPGELPDVDEVKEVFRQYQQRTGKDTFKELTVPEMAELIEQLIPLFDGSLDQSTSEEF